MNTVLKVVKQKLRFQSGKGLVTAEDVFDLPLTKLKSMANSLNRGLKTSTDDLFSEKSVKETEDSLRLSFILQVIEIREEENVSKVTAKETEQKRELLKSLIAQKKLEATSSMSIEDLEKELDNT